MKYHCMEVDSKCPTVTKTAAEHKEIEAGLGYIECPNCPGEMISTTDLNTPDPFDTDDPEDPYYLGPEGWDNPIGHKN